MRSRLFKGTSLCCAALVLSTAPQLALPFLFPSRPIFPRSIPRGPSHPPAPDRWDGCRPLNLPAEDRGPRREATDLYAASAVEEYGWAGGGGYYSNYTSSTARPFPTEGMTGVEWAQGGRKRTDRDRAPLRKGEDFRPRDRAPEPLIGQTQPQQPPAAKSPFPSKPSDVFLSLASSQFELLANSVLYPPSSDPSLTSPRGDSKIKSMALYLPQENPSTGQLEFIPGQLYPCPTTERVFIASQSGSGLLPTIPRTLTKLPGFAHAQSLLPAYPFSSGGSSPSAAGAAAVGTVEEVMCDLTSGTRGSALSVPLYFGSRTVGVLLIWPAAPPEECGGYDDDECWDPWTEEDKDQVSRTAHSLALALSMDSERAESRAQTERFRVALEDNLHQVKNPLQAMRTYAKLLQRKIAMEEGLTGTEGPENRSAYRGPLMGRTSGTSAPHLLSLAENMMVQSDRVVNLLLPMDSLVDDLEKEEERWQQKQKLLRPSVPPPEPKELTLWHDNRGDTAAKGRTYEQSLSETEHNVVESTRPSQKPMNAATATPASRNEMLRDGVSTPPSSIEGTFGPVEIEIAFVPDVLDPITSAFAAIAAERGIAFELRGMGDDAELPGVRICPNFLQEAVANVLDNAIKYVSLGKGGRMGGSNPAPRVRLTVAANQEPVKAGVTVLVEDNGPGVPLEERGPVFERGYRGDRTRLVQGSGIGLDICRSMVEGMGGFIDIIDNMPGQLNGTVIRIILFRDADIKIG